MADFFMSLMAVIILMLLVVPLGWHILCAISVNQDVSDEVEHCYWSTDHWQADGSLKLKALAHMDDAISIPKDLHNVTLEDFITERLKRSPNSGDTVLAFDQRFVVMTRTHGVVGQVLVYPDKQQNGIHFHLSS